MIGNAAIQAAPTGSAFGQVSAGTKATAANQAAAGIVPCTGGVCIPLAQRQNIPGYPRVNHISGDAEFNLTTAMVNAGYDISDNVQLYSFGSFGHRVAKAFENDRLPTQIIAAPASISPARQPICRATTRQSPPTALRRLAPSA